ncbi:MAG TPA: hypothetical protein PL110_01730 [Candidatus Eremiobacteraeota bacterium]|nr:MAG: hypothetical protein BWY64_00066 [bacterium ADurb.Bin363]HPZ06809.1 hypothetical protein [Candidatus Eremiobacteraeota bacterium]
MEEIRPKTIILHPCPMCKTSMEVELIEIKKQLIEGQIDLEDVTKEWRHVCPKCEHDTTKYIKICHYCKVPDDISKLRHNETAVSKAFAYYHPECERKANMPYPIIGALVFLIIVGVLLGIRYVSSKLNKGDVAISCVQKAENLLSSIGDLSVSFAKDPEDDKKYREKYQKNRDIAINYCLKAKKINPYYGKTYYILAKIYNIDGNPELALKTCNSGLTIKNLDPNTEKALTDFKNELKKSGVKL